MVGGSECTGVHWHRSRSGRGAGVAYQQNINMQQQIMTASTSSQGVIVPHEITQTLQEMPEAWVVTSVLFHGSILLETIAATNACIALCCDARLGGSDLVIDINRVVRQACRERQAGDGKSDSDNI